MKYIYTRTLYLWKTIENVFLYAYVFTSVNYGFFTSN